MQSNARCLKRRLVVLVIGASWLTGCATAGFEANGLAKCPPVKAFSREVQARAAEGMGGPPDESVVDEMMSGYAVMRGEMRSCEHSR